MRRKARKNMLKLRSIGIRDYSVLEGEQRIGRIRFAGERMPGVWLWNVIVHLTGGTPHRVVKGPRYGQPEFKAAWEALKARTQRPISSRRPTRP